MFDHNSVNVVRVRTAKSGGSNISSRSAPVAW